MKSVVIIAIMIITGTARATLLMQEGFDYPAETLDGTQTNGTGFAAGTSWGSANGAIVAGLAYPGLANSGTGAIQSPDWWSTHERTAASAYGGHTFYMSMLVNVGGQETERCGFEFRNSDGPLFGRVAGGWGMFAGPNGKLGISNSGGSYQTWTGVTNTVDSATHLMVVKIDYEANAVKIYIDPIPDSVEPSPSAVLATGGKWIVNLNGDLWTGIRFLHAGANMTGDELRIGTTWSDVVPATAIQATVQEGFDYATGALDGTQTNGVGFAVGTSWGAANVSIVAGLSYPGLATSGSGALKSPGWTAQERATASAYGGHTFYMSMLVNVGGQETVRCGFELRNSDGPLFGRVGGGWGMFAGPNGKLGISNSGGDFQTWTGVTNAADTATHLIVAKVDYEANAIKLFVDPAVNWAEPAPSAVLATGGKWTVNLNGDLWTGVRFLHEGGDMIGDELRIGKTWGSVVPLQLHTWTQTVGGAYRWVTRGNWAGGEVPNPTAGCIIDCGSTDLSGDMTLALDAPRTATLWKFGDIVGAQTWTVVAGTSGGKLVLVGKTPAIQVDQNTATIAAPIDGVDGLTKTGAGTLILAASNTFSGRIAVDAGTLVFQAEHSISPTARLHIKGDGDAKVCVADGLTVEVSRLAFGDAAQVGGTWGASSSGAEHIDNVHFSGSGRILNANTAQMVTECFVAPDGTTTNSGTLLSPFASLERARDTLRSARQQGDLSTGGVTVWLREGLYMRTNTFELSDNDSGTVAIPVTYRAYPGEAVRLHGARLLQPEWFTAVTNGSTVWARLDAAARGHVMQVDLTAHGISDFGALRNRGFYSSSTLAAMELFFDTVPQPLARWPDVGETGADATNGFAYTAGTTSSTTFTYSGTRPSRWSQAEEIWYHGLWKELWADNHVRGTGIDTNSSTVTLAEAPVFGIASGQPYYAENLLEEITTTGEWYLNRATGILYFWPPSGPSGHEIYISMLESPLVRLNSVQQTTFRDITFEMARGDLLAIANGDHNRVLNCTLRNAGNYAAKISGYRNGVSGCEIRDTGDGGVMLFPGGDRATLTGSGNYVRNSTIHGFGRWSWMYAPGVMINADGVGLTVAHNLLYDAPHSAILIGGCNYNLVEFNEMHDVCNWSADAGAFYTGGDQRWGHGTIIRHNFIHHINGRFDFGYGTHGIYLDGDIAGIEVFGNICYQISEQGIAHSGGRDVLMQNNMLVQCGLGLNTDTVTRSWPIEGVSNVWARLQALPYRGTIWAIAFPELAVMPANWDTVVGEGWMAPHGCVFSRNMGFNNMVWINNGNNATSYYSEAKDNLPNSDPLFVDEANLNLTLRPDSPAFTLPGFVDIPFSRIGPERGTFNELASWDFPSAIDRAGFSFDARAAASDLTVSGMTAAAVPGHPTWGVGVAYDEIDATNETGAVAAGDYFAITLSPLAQQRISLAEMSVEHRKSGAAAGATLFVRSSADGYTATLGAATTSGSNVWNTGVIRLSGVAGLQNRNAPVTLRIYCYKPSGDDGAQQLSIDNIRLSGANRTADIGRAGVRMIIR